MFKKISFQIIVSIFFGIGFFFAFRPVLADLIVQPDVTQNPAPGLVGTEIVDGYNQIFLLYDGQKTFLTTGTQNSTDPQISGDYVTWSTKINGAGQIFLYHIPTKSTIQLSTSRVNLRPQVSTTGYVTWERWINNTWQVMLFDGVSTRKISTDNTAINPKLASDFVVYSQLQDSGQWTIKAYSISGSKTVDVITGPGLKKPETDGDSVILPSSESAKISSFFTLAEIAVPTPEVYSEVDIINQIENQSSPVSPDLTPTTTLEPSPSAPTPELDLSPSPTSTATPTPE
jgi:hypothetical protein